MAIRVYKVNTTAKPPKGNFPHYAPLITKSDRDENWLGLDEFNGRPFSKKWRTLELIISMPRLPRPDFFDFGGSVFVCNERAVELAGDPLEMAGELLPVRVKGEQGRFWVFNTTNCIEVLDARKSKWEHWGPAGQYKRLVKPAFVRNRLGEISIFKFPEDGASRIYCIERSGEIADSEFKATVEHHRLTGLEFELIWSSK